MPSFAPALATVLLLAFGASSAQAHKLKVFATAVGNDVSGYAYFSPGGRAQEVAVTVTLPDGRVIQHLTTDDHGEFHFSATQRATHTILVDAGDGHEATYHVPADELGGSLMATTAAADPKASEAAAAAASVVGPSAIADTQLATVIDQAVARQLRPLREQIDAWQEKIWLHDVLGGLGYIIGMGGLVYGLTGNRRSRASEARLLKEARQ
jgi:nickel transport protein